MINHTHQWEPVILSYWNKEFKNINECAGSRCKICGRLERGFPRGSSEYKTLFAGTYIHSDTIYNAKKFKKLERVSVKNIYNLNPSN